MSNSLKEELIDTEMFCSWEKHERIAKKQGYRDGITEGQNQCYQKSFDKGFTNGFKNGFQLGKLKGQLKINSGEYINIVQEEKELKSTKLGACIICENPTLEDEQVKCIMEQQNKNYAIVISTLIQNYKLNFE